MARRLVNQAWSVSAGSCRSLSCFLCAQAQAGQLHGQTSAVLLPYSTSAGCGSLITGASAGLALAQLYCHRVRLGIDRRA